MTSVILTDEKGSRTGLMDILEAHTGEGSLHKAFSIYVFRNDGREILIQKRAQEKMLFALQWANTCCSHPRDHESPTEAGQRRLQEECGFTCDLRDVGSFVYRAPDPSGKGIEYEHVTLLRGDVSDAIEIAPNPSEIAEIKWIEIDELQRQMRDHPNEFAPWFHLGLPKVLAS